MKFVIFISHKQLSFAEEVNLPLKHTTHTNQLLAVTTLRVEG